MFDNSMWDTYNIVSKPSLSDFPEKGEIGTIYIDTTNKIMYLWDAVAESYITDGNYDDRIKILEDNYGIKEIWESKTTTTGTLTTYANTTINQDKWIEGLYNAYVVKIQDGRPKDELAVDSSGNIVFVNSLDANGNYVLSALPSPTPFAIIWQVEGKAKDLALIPEDRTLDEFEIETPFVRDGNGDIKSLNSSDNLDMQAGGFKDENVITVVKLGDVSNTTLETDNKTLLGAINENRLNDLIKTGTALLYGGEISINGSDNTKFDISAGAGAFIDNYTDPENPTVTITTWENQVGISVTNIGTQPVTFVRVITSGFQQTPTALGIERDRARDEISLGVLEHFNLTNIGNVGTFTTWQKDQLLFTRDMLFSVGARINVEGNEYTASGSNLKLNKSEGVTFSSGNNYITSKKNPNLQTNPSQSAFSFFAIYRDGTSQIIVSTSDVPVDKYDPNGDGTLVDIPDGFFTAHRIYFDTSTGLTGLQYGQFVYDSLKKATLSWEQEAYIKVPLLTGVQARTILVVEKDCTDLTDKDCAKFVQLGIFGDKDIKKIENFSRFSDITVTGSGLSVRRQAISYYEDGGVLYADIAAEFNFERDDISFANADSSINTVSGDFDNDSMIAGDKIKVNGSTNNNGIFTVVSVSTSKIVVSETITNESAGADITIETPGKGDILYSFGEREFNLNCTTGAGRNGRARISLTAGTDTNPQENWAYVIKSGDEAILQQSITEPTGQYSMLFTALIPSVAFVISDNFYSSRRWTDTKEIDGRGITATILSKLRDNTTYKSGLLSTITIDTVPTPDSVNFTMTEGIVREIYNQKVGALDLSIDGALVVNDSVAPYKKITDINEITLDAQGSPLTNRRFQLIFAVSLNADGYPDKLLINLPNGSYISDSNAFNDIDGYSVTNFPSEFKSVYLLGAGVFSVSGGGNTWTNIAITEGGVNIIDLRGSPLGVSSSGSGTSAITDFSDADITIFNSIDATKIIKFDASNITTGNTRNIIMADRDVNLDSPIFTSVQISTNTEIKEVSGDTVIENTSAINDIIHKLGDASGITNFKIQDSAGVDLFSVESQNGETQIGKTGVASVLELNDNLDVVKVKLNSVGNSFFDGGDILVNQIQTDSIIERTLDNGVIIEGTTLKDNNVTVTGNLFVNGDKVAVDSRISTSDYILAMNFGEVSNVVTSGRSGIETDRGSGDPYVNMFFEANDDYRIGIYYITVNYTGKTGTFNLNDEIKGATSLATGYIVSDSGSALKLKVVKGVFVDTEIIDNQTVTGSATVSGSPVVTDDTQAVATREDVPTDTGVAIWNSSTNRFETSSDVVYTGTSYNITISTVHQVNLGTPGGQTGIALNAGNLGNRSRFDIINTDNVTASDRYFSMHYNVNGIGSGLNVGYNGNSAVGIAPGTNKFKIAGNCNLTTGNSYKINDVSVLNATTLGSGVVNSSLTSVGTLTSLDVDNININGNTISSTDTNGDINIAPDKTGDVNLIFEETSTNTVVETLNVYRRVSEGNGASGIGQITNYYCENTSGNDVIALQQKITMYDAVASVEDARITYSIPENGTLTEYLEIDRDECTIKNFDFGVDGFTRFGTGNTALKCKILTGTTPTAGNTSTQATGITFAKIQSLTILVDDTAGNKMTPNFTSSGLFEYEAFINSSSDLRVHVVTGQTQVASRPYTAKIWYKE